MKKKQRTTSTNKRNRSGSKPFPDNDPEWSDLEDRYSQINGDMHKLAEMLAQE